jgi:orotidine-5'-phosphate decarboxylase
MMTSEVDVRHRLALALDVPDLATALRTARELAPWFGIAKVGLELYSAAGPDAITRLRELGLDVFADLKLHDIPTTVGRAARVLGGHGVRYLNMHAAGGETMLRAGVDGLRHGAADAGHARPNALAVTVLTSDDDASAFDERLSIAVSAGCDGVVCSMHETARAKAARMFTIVPGVRMRDDDRHDQARVGTPEEALAAGADVLVIGRAVTRADDPPRAAQAVHAAVLAARMH